MQPYVHGKLELSNAKIQRQNAKLQAQLDQMRSQQQSPPKATPIGDTSLEWIREIAPEVLERHENQNAFNQHKQAADLAIVAPQTNVRIPLPTFLYESIRDRNWQIQEAIEIAVLRYCDNPQTFNIHRINQESQDSSWLEIGRFEWHEVTLTANAYRYLKAEGADSFRMYAIVRCALRLLLGIN